MSRGRKREGEGRVYTHVLQCDERDGGEGEKKEEKERERRALNYLKLRK